jgi:hypothetical protein
MSLRLQAASDIATILTDTDDFGWTTTVTDPNELSKPVIGFSNDIAQVIDPQTGLVVSGRVANQAVSLLLFSRFQLWNPQVLPPYRKASRANRVNHGVWILTMFTVIHIRSRFRRPIRIELPILSFVFWRRIRHDNHTD